MKVPEGITVECCYFKLYNFLIPKRKCFFKKYKNEYFVYGTIRTHFSENLPLNKTLYTQDGMAFTCIGIKGSHSSRRYDIRFNDYITDIENIKITHITTPINIESINIILRDFGGRHVTDYAQYIK